MGVENLEKWESLKVPRGKPEATFFHRTGGGSYGDDQRAYSPLGLKVRASGSRSWIWEYRAPDGRKVRRTYGSPPDITYRDAQKAVAQDVLLLNEGKNPVLEGAKLQPAGAVTHKGKTVAALIDTYIAAMAHFKGRSGKRLSTGYVGKVKKRLGIVRDEWGSSPVASIDRAAVHALLDKFNGRDAMQELMQAHIGSMFSFAVDRGILRLDQHPSKGMKLRGGSQSRKRFLNEAELRLALPALWEAAYPGGHAMLLMLATGRRPNEVLRAEWSEFDLEDKTWRLPGDPSERAFPDRRDGNGTAKNRVAHTLPLSPMAIDILREAAKHRVGDNGRFVFHGPGDNHKPTDNIRFAQDTAIKAAASATAKRREPEQRDDFHLHDMRRTAASTLEILEAPDAVVKAALNHSDKRGVTALYMRMMSDEELRLELLRKWLDRLSAHYEEMRKPVLQLPPPSPERPAGELPAPDAAAA